MKGRWTSVPGPGRSGHSDRRTSTSLHELLRAVFIKTSPHATPAPQCPCFRGGRECSRDRQAIARKQCGEAGTSVPCVHMVHPGLAGYERAVRISRPFRTRAWSCVVSTARVYDEVTGAKFELKKRQLECIGGHDAVGRRSRPLMSTP